MKANPIPPQMDKTFTLLGVFEYSDIAIAIIFFTLSMVIGKVLGSIILIFAPTILFLGGIYFFKAGKPRGHLLHTIRWVGRNMTDDFHYRKGINPLAPLDNSEKQEKSR